MQTIELRCGCVAKVKPEQDDELSVAIDRKCRLAKQYASEAHVHKFHVAPQLEKLELTRKK